jgi:hypothetical protein
MTPEQEATMTAAHRLGMSHAGRDFANACDVAMSTFKGDQEAQLAYVAGYAANIRRIAARAQNKGFRT